MTRAEAADTLPTVDDAPPAKPAERALFLQLVLLALPILAENLLHMLVGLTDVYVAGHLRENAAAATAAVGSVAYVLWFIGLIVATIATGSTAVIARAIGAKHRSLANSVCGQSATAAVLLGVTLSLGAIVFARPIAAATGLTGDAHDYALFYIRALGISLPFSTFLFAANACLRGAGDTMTPAISMVLVDGTNAVLSIGLARGLFGLPELGFQGIAIGTVTAYAGVLQFAMLVRPRRGAAAPAPAPAALAHDARILRIGLPSGAQNLISWPRSSASSS